MIKKITLSEDHIKLLRFVFLQEEGDNKVVVDKNIMFSLGSHLLEDMSMILGLQDKAIKGTEDDPNGRAFPDDVEKYMLDLHQYITDNLYYIISLVFQYVDKGLTPGTYQCKDNELIWKKNK